MGDFVKFSKKKNPMKWWKHGFAIETKPKYTSHIRNYRISNQTEINTGSWKKKCVKDSQYPSYDR